MLEIMLVSLTFSLSAFKNVLIARVVRIESQLNKGLQQVTSFIDKLFSSGDMSVIEQSKRQSLMEHTSSTFSRMSLFKAPVIPAIKKKVSEEGENT